MSEGCVRDGTWPHLSFRDLLISARAKGSSEVLVEEWVLGRERRGDGGAGNRLEPGLSTYFPYVIIIQAW